MASLDLGMLKLQFNNEILKVKKFILQAKTQVIHKLTRNVEKIKKRKGTEDELKKFKTKSDSIVSEIMFIKKINHHDLGRFAIQNFDNLTKIMNTPIPTEEKAMAKLLSHKCLNSKFQEIVKQFSVVPSNALLRVDPEKIRKKENKKKAKLREKLKSQNKNEDKTVTESRKHTDEKQKSKRRSSDIDDSDLSNDERDNSFPDIQSDGDDDDETQNINESDEEAQNSNESEDATQNINESDEEAQNSNESDEEAQYSNESDEETQNTNESETDSVNEKRVSKNARVKNVHVSESEDQFSDESGAESEDNSKKLVTNKAKRKEVKHKLDDIEEEIFNESKSNVNNESSVKKNKKPKRIYADLEDNEAVSLKTEKTVDSFFLTDSGDNYLTLNLPRKPDSLQASESSGPNRKMRRAARFGNEVRPRKQPHNNTSGRFGKMSNNDESVQFNGNKRQQFDDTQRPRAEVNKTEKEEKLHPSWEAKKKKSSLMAFEGKKVVFGD